MGKRQAPYVPLQPLSRYAVSERALDEFVAIYKAEYGEDLSREQAMEMASDLIALYKRIILPLPSEKKAPPSATYTTSTSD